MTAAGLGVANVFTNTNTFNNTFTGTSGEFSSIICDTTAEPTGSSSAYYRGIIFNAIQNSTNALTQAASGLTGIFGSAYLINSGLVTLAIGVQGRVQAYGANNSNATGVRVFDAQVINWGGGGTMTIADAYNFYARNPSGAALTISGVAYGYYCEAINKGSGGNYAWYSNAGNIMMNAGGDANTDFTVKSDNYDALFIDGSNDSIDLMHNASGKIGVFAATPVTRHAHIADATDAATVITVANHVLSVLEEYGWLASA
jgi:hypothetical protein